jgi:hypothetical protein
MGVLSLVADQRHLEARDEMSCYSAHRPAFRPAIELRPMALIQRATGQQSGREATNRALELKHQPAIEIEPEGHID